MISGFLVIDKPKGITSHDVISVLRKKLGIRKIGHSGTLDPLASGVLVCAVNEGTKFLEYLCKDTSKTYEAEIKLGYVSATCDAEGPLTKQENNIIPTKNEIENVLKENFKGLITQTPPIYSSIKIKGKPAYSYARKGEAVVLKSRNVNVYNVKIIEYKYPLLKVELEVSSGFYVRSFATNMGDFLGTGAYLYNLKRIQLGFFGIQDSITLDHDIENNILSLETILPLFENKIVTKEELSCLQKGQNILKDRARGGQSKEYKFPLVAVFENKIKAILESRGSNQLKVRKLINFDE